MTADPSAEGALLHTALHGRHVSLGARMVDFGGWHMPIQYPTGILAEHRAVRAGVGVFDLSHMGRLYLRGSEAFALGQALTTNDVHALRPGRAQYSLICDDSGHILDDIITYRTPAEADDDGLLLVVNASNRLAVLERLAEIQARYGLDDAICKDYTLESVMIGVQGPESEAVMTAVVGEAAAQVRYYASVMVTLHGKPALLARTGYTGEDGFEVVVAAVDGPSVWDEVLEARGSATPMACGLGARDTLRLEAGMPLYGHEIDRTRTPYEAGLGRVVKLDKGDFGGRAALAEQAVPPKARLIAFQLLEGGVPRQGYPVLIQGERGGAVTSGNVSPSLGHGIGMAYVPASSADIGTELAIEIRGKPVAARVVELPFYAHRTRRFARAR
ncbi:MAG: glycine cleavage system aminomethyltransferase GcvT [Chloroflexota bacterium]